MPELFSLAPAAPVPQQEWLLPDLIPRAELVLLDGNSGVGKTLITAVLAACASQLQQAHLDRLVLILSSPEQSSLLTEFLVPQGPDYDHLRGIQFHPVLGDSESMPSLAPQLLRFIEATLKEHHPAILFMDSLEEVLQLGGETDTRQLFDLWTSLRTLAHTHDCSLIISRKNGLHENRQYGPFTRIGSDIARVGLTMHWHPIDPTMRIITVAKNQRGPVGEQTHFRIEPDGTVFFISTEPYEHVRPSRSPATWQPDPVHILDEDKVIIELVEKLLRGRPASKIELQNMVTRAGISVTAFQRAMSKAKLRNFMMEGIPCVGPTHTMLYRHSNKHGDEEKAPENQARAPGSAADQQQTNPRHPIRPTPSNATRQAG